MGAISDLPPELQEIETELQAASQRGDLDACRALVSRLATEAELGQAACDEAERTILETEEDIEVFPEIRERAIAHIDNQTKARLTGMLAVARHQYAVMRLHQIENATK